MAKKKKTEKKPAPNKNVVWTFPTKEVSPSVLALDTATSCGWAWTDGKTLLSGTLDLKDALDERHMKFIKINAFLRKMKEEHNITQVVFEAVRHSGGDKPQGRAIICQSELQGNVKHFCDIYGLPYYGYSSTEVKKFATGHGMASKELMVEAAEKRYGFAPETHDEADALHILDKYITDFII